MKKCLAVIIPVLLLFSCKKTDSPTVADPATKPDISDVPARFNQKILLEEFTSSECGQCPEAHLLRDSLMNDFSGRLYTVSIHVKDLMADSSISNPTTGANYIDSLFNPSGIYPSGMINRQVSGIAELIPGHWGPAANGLLGAIPRCGLAIDAQGINGDALSLVVYTGFSTNMGGDYRLHVYLVQNVLQSPDTLYGQINDFSFYGLTPDSNSSLYTLPDTIVGYSHKYILKRIITDNGLSGDGVPPSLMTAGNQFVKTYSVNLIGVNTSNSAIIAFIDKYGPSGTTHRIENVQKVNLGDVKDWN